MSLYVALQMDPIEHVSISGDSTGECSTMVAAARTSSLACRWFVATTTA